ncbi:MAG: ATPase [Chitinivibrionia bacterium]|nr:ATPase [Chitinivibrionia bacterium]
MSFAMQQQRIKTGITGFDEMLDGGFLPNSANLIEGAPGTGKTTIAMQFIYNGITKYNENGLIISFEEFPVQYYHDAAQLGWDLKTFEKEEKLKILFSNPETILKEISEINGELINLMKKYDVKRVVIDSISHFESLTRDVTELREIERQIINGFKKEGTTSILIRENNSILGQISAMNSKIPFVVDSYILLRYVEIDSEIQKALTIFKMRGSDHKKDIRRYQCTKNGVEVESKFVGREGIMSGNSRATPQDAFVNVFGKKKS